MRKQTGNRNRGWLPVIGNRLSVAAGVALAAGMLAGTAQAQTVYWRGTNTVWTNPGNWTNGTDSTPVLPGPGTNVVIDLSRGATAQPLLNLSGGVVTIASLVVSDATSTVTLTFTNGDVSAKYLNVTGDVTIGTNGTLTHAAETATGTTVGNENQRLYLVVGGNLTITQGGSINVDNTGYGPGQGPAAGQWTGTGSGSIGGGHGGAGGPRYGAALPQGNGINTYGSITNPVNAGSGATSTARGGGVAVLKVTGAVTLNGVIRANGMNGGGNWQSAAAAGGSINLTAGSIAGTAGAMWANGGLNGGAPNPGGGGRIAVQLTASDAIPNSILANITAYGGTTTDGGSAAAGTIYLKGMSQTYGTLIVRNSHQKALDTFTTIRTNVTGAVVGDVIVGYGGMLNIDPGYSLTAYGSWSNGSGYAVGGNNLLGQGTVVLAGTDAATVWGSNTWYNLTITNAGKTVKFEAGKTQTINASGNLTLAGASGNLLNLQSTTATTQWKLKAAVGSTHGVNFVNVTNSDASAGNTIIAFNSTGPSQNNINWAFGADTNVWTGGSTAWNSINNWSLGRVPTYLDTVIVSNVANACVLDTARQIGELKVLAGGVLNLNSLVLSVLGNVNNAGTIGATGTLQLAGTTAQTMTAGGNTFGTVDIANTGTVSFLDGFMAARLSCTNGGTTLNFKDGSTYTVGILYLIGASGNNMKLRSLSTGTQWKLNVTGNPVVCYVDAQDSDASLGRTVYASSSTDSTPGSNINWDFGAGKFWIGATGGAWTNSANWAPSGAPAAGSYVVIEGGSVTLNVTNLLTISSLTLGSAFSSTLTVSNGNVTSKGLIVTNNVIIGPYGTLTHAAVTASGATIGDEDHRLYLVVSNTLTIAQGGSINVDYKGYGPGQGPAAGQYGGGGQIAIGGGHGGAGGTRFGPDGQGNGINTYGSITNPVNAGSGANDGSISARGGGVAVLKVTGAVTLNGVISANGMTGSGSSSWHGASGAGGSINLTAGSIAGTAGAMRANGGLGNTPNPGGGGRIAVQLTASDAIPNSILTNITAYGGTTTEGSAAPAGTIYLKGMSQTYGTLIVRNSHQKALDTFTTIRTNVTGAVVGDVIVGYGGMLNIAPGYSLTAYGSWSNGSGYSVGGTNLWGQGTVVLAGTNAATVWGSNTWYNLTITNAGKVVKFEAGKTQNVAGTPTFDNLVTLQSTTDGSKWILTKGSTGSTQNVGKVYVRDSNASAGNTFNALGGSDLGNNLNWKFPPKGTVILMR